MTIVGIVGDVKMDWSDTRPLYAVYRPTGNPAQLLRIDGA